MKKITYTVLFVLIFLSGCAKIDPRHVEIEIPSGTPELKETELSQALKKLGMMTEVYGVKARVMIDKISDNTGSAEHTKAEIPYDITQMTVSALNLIGGNIIFIPYRPDLIVNLKNLGFNNLERKINPSVIITGGITEFDRGLETQEDSTNIGYETDKFGEKSPFGIDHMQGEKRSIASITIDYNMIDIETMSGLPGIQTANTMQVHKGIGKKELGFTLFGPTLGLKGEMKKVEGRHAALRLLVQSSMIQIIGKYLDLPYWRLLPGVKPDPVVEMYIKKGWHYQMNEDARIKKIQELLFLHGYEYVDRTGVVDNLTIRAIDNFLKKKKVIIKSFKEIYFSLYKMLYYSVPLDDAALNRRYILIIKNKTPPLPKMGGASDQQHSNETKK